MNHHRSFWLRFWPWCVISALLLIIATYRWNHKRMWTLAGHDGHPVCQVQPGWTEHEVLAHCGPRSGRGMQPKVAAAGSGLLDLQMCSAPGDVYGTKVVLYGCDGRVQAVENMPAQGFIYPSQDEPVATPESAAAASNEVSQALVGKQITIHGRLSVRCKLPVCIKLDNRQLVYLFHTMRENSYAQMEGKGVSVTGILRFYHDPDATSRPSAVARLPDLFYFEAETAQVRLISQ